MSRALYGGSPVWKRSKLIHLVFLICFIAINHQSIYGQNLIQSTTFNHYTIMDEGDHPGSGSHWFAGAKVGLVYLFGLELQYNLATNGVNRMYLAAAAQSSLIVNSANIGGGVFLGKTGLGLGCRYHHLLWFENEGEGKVQPGYGPEIIWNKKIGEKNLINLHVGGIITKDAFFPDISFGLMIPLK